MKNIFSVNFAKDKIPYNKSIIFLPYLFFFQLNSSHSSVQRMKSMLTDKHFPDMNYQTIVCISMGWACMSCTMLLCHGLLISLSYF